jgi:spore maturation protein SpmB
MSRSILFLFVITRTTSILFFGSQGDVELYFRRFSKIESGQRPYEDFLVEYPPLALVYALLPSLAGATNFGEFYHTFRLFSYALDALSCFLVAQILAKRETAFYLLATFALGPVVYDRIDIALSFLLVLTVFALRERRETSAQGLIGIGFAFKLVPALAAPALLLRSARSSGALAAVRGGSLAAAVAIAPFAIAFALYGSGVFELFRYHFERGVQIESIWSNLQLVRLGSTAPHFVVFRHGCHNLATETSRLLLPVSTLLGGAVLATSLALAWRREARAEEILAWTIVSFIAVGKVLSPQFFVFLSPLLLVLSRKRDWYGGLVVLLSALTTCVYPFRYGELLQGRLDAVVALSARNALLLFLVCYSLVDLWKRRAEEVTSAPEETRTAVASDAPEKGTPDAIAARDEAPSS